MRWSNEHKWIYQRLCFSFWWCNGYILFQTKNSPFNCEIANINDASTILSIHEEYIKAGCMAIKTNTFAANETLLECDFKTVKDIIKVGMKLH